MSDERVDQSKGDVDTSNPSSLLDRECRVMRGGKFKVGGPVRRDEDGFYVGSNKKSDQICYRFKASCSEEVEIDGKGYMITFN